MPGIILLIGSGLLGLLCMSYVNVSMTEDLIKKLLSRCLILYNLLYSIYKRIVFVGTRLLNPLAARSVPSSPSPPRRFRFPRPTADIGLVRAPRRGGSPLHRRLNSSADRPRRRFCRNGERRRESDGPGLPAGSAISRFS